MSRPHQGTSLLPVSGLLDPGEAGRILPGGRGGAVGAVPTVSKPWIRWFGWYSRAYLRRHFHALRLSRAGACPNAGNGPVVLFLNHASWWDALVGLVLTQQLFPQRTTYAPIDAAMLKRYAFFRKLGFFGVERGTTRGARAFLQTTQAILHSPNALLAITPQADFVDVRRRPIRFAPGLGHLAASGVCGTFIPLAVEYVYWEERLPEVLLRFGKEIRVGPHQTGLTAHDWTGVFESALTEVQDSLARQAESRCPDDFEDLLRGRAGQGGVYDGWCWLRSMFRGEPFRRQHGFK